MNDTYSFHNPYSVVAIDINILWYHIDWRKTWIKGQAIFNWLETWYSSSFTVKRVWYLIISKDVFYRLKYHMCGHGPSLKGKGVTLAK